MVTTEKRINELGDPSIIVYQYFSAENAIRCIETRSLKISTIHNLNDPFEVRPVLSEVDQNLRPDKELFLREWRERMALEVGLLCFSATKTCPLIWSHYADRHRGIAIGFEYTADNGRLRHVSYPDTNERPIVDFSNPSDTSSDKGQEIFLTKAKDWKYEEEYRELVSIQDCKTSEGYYFTNDIIWNHMGQKQRVPKEVILGANCSVCPSYFRKTLIQNGFNDVTIMKARLSEDKYSVDSETV
ncbi:MAG TPA: DUF2971 domain-containing protein [Desulfuromonadales bacterium]|nr:DUF2971 domain-containing protein [Desulfuromonadales bacterium]